MEIKHSKTPGAHLASGLESEIIIINNNSDDTPASRYCSGDGRLYQIIVLAVSSANSSSGGAW